MVDELLKKYGVKYEDLTPAELETFNVMVSALQQTQLTVETIKESIQVAKSSVEQEIAQTPSNFFMWLFGWKREFVLKARLKNYLLLEQLLTSPEKAKKALEQSLKNIK